MMTVNEMRHVGRPIVIDMTTEECIWSAAGATPYRLCHNAFDCTTCSFDRKMQRVHQEAIKESRRSGVRPVEALWGGRKCRHMLSGYVLMKYCAHNFHCADCEYDQLIEHEVRCLTPVEPAVDMIAGYTLAHNYYYHRGHAWARVEYGGQVRVGIDDFARRLLGPPTRYTLPNFGSNLDCNQPVAGLDRDKHHADLLSPVQGAVVAVNPEFGPDPTELHGSSYSSGWLAIIQPTHLARDLKILLFGREANVWLENEAERLERIIHPELNYRLAATGARPLDDIFGNVAGLDWDQLAKEFLLN